MEQPLKNRLDHIATLAQAGKWQRLLHAPKRYISGQYFSKAVYPSTKKGKLVDAHTFFGKTMKVLLPAGMDIYLLGAKTHDSEIRLSRWMLNNLQAGDTVLDIGTHFGFYSLLAAELVGASGRVIGMEASRAVHEICQQNISGAENVSLFHLAATDEDTELSFYEFPVLYSEYNTIDPAQFEGAAWLKDNPPLSIRVKGVRADSLLESCKAIPDFIKIDVEGAEAKVIKGLRQTLKEHQVIVALEYLSDERTNKAHTEAAQLLAGLGYNPFFINQEGKAQATLDIKADMERLGLDSDNVLFIKSV